MCLQKWQRKGTGLITKFISMEEPHIVKADEPGGNKYPLLKTKNYAKYIFMTTHMNRKLPTLASP